jgi:predicted DNA-binding protein YlxM (UPF0122 family)
MPRGNYLSDEQAAQITHLYRETDLPLAEIAARCAVSVSGILRIIKARGIAHRKTQHKRMNKTIDKDAVALKYQNGAKIADIAETENASWSAIFAILKERGIALRGKGFGDSMSPDRPDEKRCNCCKEWKPLSGFQRSARYVGGVLNTCKVCCSERNRRSKAKNPQRRLLSALKTRASQKGLEFDLTESDLEMPNRCPVLGIPIRFNNGTNGDDSISVDRIDNTKGYVRGNVIIVSRRANCLKNSATLDELERIYLFYKNLEIARSVCQR